MMPTCSADSRRSSMAVIGGLLLAVHMDMLSVTSSYIQTLDIELISNNLQERL